MSRDDAAKYAAKWRADGHADDEPTDDALRAAFARCALPPRASHYPAIRDAILAAVTCRHCGAPSPDEFDVCPDCFDLRSHLWRAFHYVEGSPHPDAVPCPVPACAGTIHAEEVTT